VCCTSINDMGHALDTIRSRPEPPDHVVIELSGIAEPKNMLPWGRSAGFLLDGVVIVVAVDQLLDDALPHWIRLHLEAQVAVADLLVLTKTDLAEPEAVAAARTRLAELAPRTPVVDGGLGRREQGMLGRFLALGGHRSNDMSGIPGPTLFDLHETHIVGIDGPLTGQAVDDLVADLPRRFPGRIVARAKGVVELADDDNRPALVQVVGSRLQVTPLFDSERQASTDLVVITVAADP
jgi:G3E family GTPase